MVIVIVRIDISKIYIYIYIVECSRYSSFFLLYVDSIIPYEFWFISRDERSTAVPARLTFLRITEGPRSHTRTIHTQNFHSTYHRPWYTITGSNHLALKAIFQSE